MTPLKTTRIKVWLVVIGVFLLGGVTGAALTSVYRMKASERQEMRGRRNGKGDGLERMKRDLNLSDSQATEIRAILDQTRNEYRALREECRPRYDAVRQSARSRIRALLAPDQQQRFDALAAERDARRKDERKDDER